MYDEKEKWLEKLKKAAARQEAKGIHDSAFHTELARLQGQSPEAVSPRNAKKAKPEDKDAEG
jgi:hypothetical protein